MPQPPARNAPPIQPQHRYLIQRRQGQGQNLAHLQAQHTLYGQGDLRNRGVDLHRQFLHNIAQILGEIGGIICGIKAGFGGKIKNRHRHWRARQGQGNRPAARAIFQRQIGAKQMIFAIFQHQMQRARIIDKGGIAIARRPRTALPTLLQRFKSRKGGVNKFNRHRGIGAGGFAQIVIAGAVGRQAGKG